jgi:methylamine dehydrogenase heavy chain
MWVNDVAFNHMNDGRAYLLDADAGEFLGMISAGQAHGVCRSCPMAKASPCPKPITRADRGASAPM